ncbi:MAG: hypothetical protein IH586_15760 [Anaerolineaceae bacterium]|nr:hypothetical protein [Anaerolineaceae bacterium]
MLPIPNKSLVWIRKYGLTLFFALLALAAGVWTWLSFANLLALVQKLTF